MNRKFLSVIYIQLFLLLAISINTFPVASVYQETVQDQVTASMQVHQPPKSVTIINGMEGNFEPTFHPMLDFQSILSLPFDTLVELDPVTNDVVPSLAKQWVVTNDSREWTFYIRENVICHDGSLLNASAVAAAFEMILDPTQLRDYNPQDPNPPGTNQFYAMPLESIKIIDEFTIRITFSIPYSPFIRIQAPKIRIPSLTSYPAINIEDFNQPIGSGPYVLENRSLEVNFYNYTFTKFSNYFRGDPPFETVHYLLYWNLEDAKEAVLAQKGEVGPLYSNSSDINFDYWKICQHQPNGLDLGFLNHQRSESLANIDVRRALNYAINKEEYIEDQKLLGYPLNIYLAKSILLDESLRNDQISGFPYDPELASSLLDEAGYPRKKEEDGYRFSLKITGVPWIKDEIFRFGDYLDQIGIRCSFTVPDPGSNETFWSDIFYSGDWDIYFDTIGFSGDWIYDSYTLFNSQGVTNSRTQVSDPSLESYTSLCIQTPVKQEEAFYLSKIAQRVDEYVPHILLAEVEYGYLKTAAVESYIWVDPIPFGGIYFNYDNKIIPKIIEDVEITNQSIYFPFTDGIITTEKVLIVTSEISHNHLSTFNRKERGKYFKTTVDDQETEYLLRCYFDPNEIPIPVGEEIPIFQWNAQTQQWNELEPVARNSSLNYVELKVQGDILVRVGEGIIELTFKYLPGATLAIGILVTIAAVTIYYNYRQANYLRRKYELT